MFGAYFDYEGTDSKGKRKLFWLNENFLIDRPQLKPRVARREVLILFRRLLTL